MLTAPNSILNLQFLLLANDCDPGPLDGMAGPRTMAAREHFIVSRQIPTDQPMLVWTTALQGAGAGVGAVNEGLHQLGYHEDPPGSNRTKFGVWYGVDGVKWCAIFVSYSFVASGGPVLCADYDGAGVRKGKGCSYVPTILDWLRHTDRVVPVDRVKVGDIAIFDWDGNGRPDHIGMVVDPRGLAAGGSFLSLEGNTSSGNDSNGGRVMARPRHAGVVSAFGRV